MLKSILSKRLDAAASRPGAVIEEPGSWRRSAKTPLRLGRTRCGIKVGAFLLRWAFLCVLCGNFQTADAAKPNFVFINIDDLGYADIEPFGSTLNRTPNLNRMAAEGRRLTTFYAAPVCSPSRAALMTGCYPKRALPIPHVLFPGNGVGLSPSEVTVAEVLKSAGYATAIVGKWHLGDQPEFLPNRQGFDLHFGLPYSNDMGPAEDGVKSDLGKPLPTPKDKGQPPLPLLRNGTVVKRVLPEDQQSLVELYTAEAVQFIAAQKAAPFLLYLAHNAVHFPIYPGKKWAGKSPHGIYSDWVEEMDWSVGEVLNALRMHGLAEQTLVIFTSDNGGTPRAVNRPLRGHKGSTWEGGMRVPTIAWWPGKVPAGTASDALCGMFDVLPTFAALAGAQLPSDRKLDGADLRSVLTGEPGGRPPHEVFYYFSGLRLEAVRDLEWKLSLPVAATNTAGQAKAKAAANTASTARLYNLKSDLGESTDLAARYPEVVARLEKLVEQMKGDLGTQGLGPGVRPLGKVEHPQPLIGYDGKVRPGFEPKSGTESKPPARQP
jgi:arylsulfatase A